MPKFQPFVTNGLGVIALAVGAVICTAAIQEKNYRHLDNLPLKQAMKMGLGSICAP